MKMELRNDTGLPDHSVRGLLELVAERVGVKRETAVAVLVDDRGMNRASIPAPFYGTTGLGGWRSRPDKFIMSYLSIGTHPRWYPVPRVSYFGEYTPRMATPTETLIGLAAHELKHVEQFARGVTPVSRAVEADMEKEAVVASVRVLEELKPKAHLFGLNWRVGGFYG